MKIKDLFSKQVGEISETYEPIIVTNAVEAATIKTDKPNFKGEVKQNKIKFPVELGEAHPFDFAITEGLYKKFGFANGVVDKFVDFIVGPGFWVDSDDDRATELIETFMRDVSFDTVIRAWIKEGLVKNGFLEIGGKEDESPKGLKVLDSKYMYVDRDEKGVVTNYNQYRGEFKRFAKKKIIPFEPYQIAHIGFNKIGDMAYGLGIMYPAMNTINNLLQNEKDLHMLMHRKANSPYHVKLGGVVGGKYFKPNPTTVEKWGGDLEWLNNKHEWVTDGLTDIKVIDFGNIGEKFNEVLKYDTDMLFYTFQVPAVIMGASRVPEGLAKVQMDAFERRVKSFQSEIEKVIEEKIFKRVLQSNGLDVHVEFHWGRPSNTERYDRIERVTNLLRSPMLSQSLVSLLEKDLVKSFELDEKEFEVMSEDEEKQKEEERKREEARPQPIVPGQNATPPKRVSKESVCPHCLDINESLNKYNDISEWLGFQYQEYIKQIEKFIKADDYDLIKASTLIEEAAGKLSESQVTHFKSILEKGFRKESSIKDMVDEVNKKVGLKDLLKMEDGKIIQKDGVDVLVRGKDNRASALVRTEVSRAANAGAIEHFKEGGIKKLRWVSSFGTRTCEQCESLNGMIFDINSHPDIPIHTNCRCTVVPVTELK